MQIEVREKNENLVITNISNKVTFVVPYCETKSYFRNVLDCFPQYAVTDFKSEEDKDVFTLSELKVNS